MRLARKSRLDAQLGRYEDVSLTYAEVGATRGELPPGYHHTRLRREVGQGDTAFRRAADVVMSWNMHRGAGLGVAASGPAVVGRTVVLAAGAGVGLVIPCRVVYVLDEPRKVGFGYGTLPDHPESGERRSPSSSTTRVGCGSRSQPSRVPARFLSEPSRHWRSCCSSSRCARTSDRSAARSPANPKRWQGS